MKNKINELRKDAIYWRAHELYTNANGNAHLLAKAIETICLSISQVKNDFVRGRYIEYITKQFKAKTKLITNIVDNLIMKTQDHIQPAPEESDYKYPSYFTQENLDDLRKNGLTQTYFPGNKKATGIHFQVGNRIEKVSNFTIESIIHIISQNNDENKKLFKITNAYVSEIVEFEQGSTLSNEKFTNTSNAKQNFMWFGNLTQLKLLMETIGYSIPRCAEVKILGWQQEGFFAFTNQYISEGKKVELNEYGIGKHREKLYFSPSQSILYKNSREDDNVYESLKYLNYHQSKISFEKWCKLMHTTYPVNGKYGILFIFVCIFRDIVLKVDGSCPHLYAWGPPGSGKSKFMESISAFFYCEKRYFALNSGTAFSFSRFLEIFRNCFHFLNELDDKTVDPQWLQVIKGAYENEGRQRGKGGNKNMTEVMKVNSGVGMAGQNIVSSDDNALPSRCIIREFKAHDNDSVPKEQHDAYNELKQLEAEGGFNSLIVEILEHRDFFAKCFLDTFLELFKEVRQTIASKNYRWNERIARNYCYMLTMAKLANEKFSLPFCYTDLYLEAIEQINNITSLITGTDATSEFWRITSMLADQRKISMGLHYIIKEVDSDVKIYNKTLSFTKPTKLLFLRLEVTHSIYKQAYRSETGKEGMNITTLKSYLENREYFLGAHNKQRFSGVVPGTHEVRNTTTSCYVFDYGKLEKLGYILNFSVEGSDPNKNDITKAESTDNNETTEDPHF